MPPSQHVIFTGGPMRDISDGSNNSNNLGGSGRGLSGSRRGMKDTSTRSNVRWSFVHQPSEGQTMMESRSGASGGQGRPFLNIEDPIDGPFQRIKDEWNDPDSWFGLDDCGRLLDVPNTFGNPQRTIIKWIVWAWFIVSLLYLWTTADNAWFLGDLDHWALGISLIYLTMSLGNSIWPPSQPGSSHESVNTYLKIYWSIFEVAAHLQLLVTMIFWIITVPTNGDNLTIDYGTFMLHGLGLLAVWIDGMSFNRIPVRIKHYLGVLIVDFIYCLWTVIPAAAGLGSDNNNNNNNGESNPDNNDAIYLSLDWSENTVQAVFLMIAILTVLAPLCFLVQYLLSLYTFPFTFNGSKSRRCIDFDMSRSCMSHSRGAGGNSARRPTLKADKNSNGNVSATSRTSSTKELSMMDNSRVRNQSGSGRRAGATSPAPPPSRRVSVVPRPTSPVPVRATSPPPPTPRPASPNKSRRASTSAPPKARPTSAPPARPTSPTPTPRRASTPTAPRRASTTPTPAAAAAKKATRRPTAPTPPSAINSPMYSAPKRKSTVKPTNTTPAPTTTTKKKRTSTAADPAAARRASTATKKNTNSGNKNNKNKTSNKTKRNSTKKPDGRGQPKKQVSKLDIA